MILDVPFNLNHPQPITIQKYILFKNHDKKQAHDFSCAV